MVITLYLPKHLFEQSFKKQALERKSILHIFTSRIIIRSPNLTLSQSDSSKESKTFCIPETTDLQISRNTSLVATRDTDCEREQQ